MRLMCRNEDGVKRLYFAILLGCSPPECVWLLCATPIISRTRATEPRKLRFQYLATLLSLLFAGNGVTEKPDLCSVGCTFSSLP